MLISIMFGQMDDAHLHMTICMCYGQTGRREGTNYDEEICKQGVSGCEAGWHPCMLPQVMAETHAKVVVKNCSQAITVPACTIPVHSLDSLKLSFKPQLCFRSQSDAE